MTFLVLNYIKLLSHLDTENLVDHYLSVIEMGLV